MNDSETGNYKGLILKTILKTIVFAALGYFAAVIGGKLLGCSSKKAFNWRNYEKVTDTSGIRQSIRSMYMEGYEMYKKDGGTGKTLSYDRRQMLQFFNTREWVINTIIDCSVIENEEVRRMEREINNKNIFARFLQYEFDVTY